MATKQVLVKTFGESAEYSKAIAIADEIKSIETTDENVTLVAVRLFWIDPETGEEKREYVTWNRRYESVEV